MNLVDGREAMLPHLIQVSLEAREANTMYRRTNDACMHFQVSIELDAKGTCYGCSMANLSNIWNRPADFPAINPYFSGQKNTYVYVGSSSGTRRFLPRFPFDSIVKLDLSNGSAKSWSTGDRMFVGEPIFVPKGTEEDDGYVLVVEVRMLFSQYLCLPINRYGSWALLISWLISAFISTPVCCRKANVLPRHTGC